LKASMPLLDRAGRALENISTFVVDLLTPLHLRTRTRLSDEELETLVESAKRKARCRRRKAR